MSRPQSKRQDPTYSSAQTEVTEDEATAHEVETTARRTASVYDTVAGRIGLNGFFTQEQLTSANVLPSLPEEVLLRRLTAPDKIAYNFYNADEDLEGDQELPDSDLLKAIHSYTSDFFVATTAEKGQMDFRTFDGSALLALGVLLEEASQEALGENGDMALVEPESLRDGLPESKVTKYQIRGRVKPRQLPLRTQPSMSETDDDLERDESPRKKRRANT